MKKLALSIIILLCIVDISQAHRFNLNLEVGKAYYHNSKSKVMIEQRYNGEEINYEMILTSKTRYYVRERKDDIFILDVKILFIEMKVGSTVNSIIFSSDTNKPNDILSKIISKMIEQKLEMKIHSNGRIEEVNNIEEMYSNAFDALPGLSNKRKKAIMRQLDNTFGEEVFKGNMEILTAIFPLVEVNTNDTWENMIKHEGDSYLTLKNLFTLKECHNNYAVIHGVSRSSSRDDKFRYSNGYQVKSEMTGNMNSTLKIDRKTGWVQNAEISQEFKGVTIMRRNFLLPKIYIPVKMEIFTKISDNVNDNPTFLEAGIIKEDFLCAR